MRSPAADPLHEADPGLAGSAPGASRRWRRRAPGRRRRCRRSAMPHRTKVAPGARVSEGAGRVGGVDGRRPRCRRRPAAPGPRRRRPAGPAVAGSVGLVGHGEVGHTPSSAERRLGDDAAGPARRRRPGGTDAVHAGVDLEVHGHVGAPPAALAALAAAVDRRPPSTRIGCRPMARRRRHPARAAARPAPARARRCRRAAAPRPPRPGPRARPAAPAVERGAGDRAPRRGRSRRPSPRPTPRPGPRPGASTPTLCPMASRSTSTHAQRVGRSAATQSASTRGQQIGQVAGDEAPGGPRRGRRRRAPTRPPPPPGAASTPWASSAPMIPESTSPVPAVASRGVARGHQQDGADGSATTVVGPLRSTTALARCGQRPGGGDPVGAGRGAAEQRRTRRRGA